jgi:hypothetical protein
MKRYVATPIILALALLVLLGAASRAEADHKDNGTHSPLLWAGATVVCPHVDQCEMNGRTVSGQTIYLRPISLNSTWLLAVAQAVNAWNAGTSDLAGFNAFTLDNTATPYVEVKAALLLSDPNPCSSQYSHGCVIYWDPTAPSGRISMYGPWLTQGNHKRSDLMHEMGHVLMNAAEHYPDYDCTSIMGHSSGEAAGPAGMCGTGTPTETLIAVQPHDRQDYLDIYGVKDDPDAVYVQMLGANTLVHYFEGGWLGGNGHTIHEERYNWIDRSITGVDGTYSAYQSPGRKVATAEDGNPENDAYAEYPASGDEWCMKRSGRAGGITSSQPNFWGPKSHAYCIRQSYNGSGVFVASNRNDYVAFRVWNFSGAQINNVALLLNDNTTHVCDLPNIANNSSAACFWWPGSGSGFVKLWYNWTEHGPIGYGVQ